MRRWCSIEDGAPLVLPAPLTGRSSLKRPDDLKIGCTPNRKPGNAVAIPQRTSGCVKQAAGTLRWFSTCFRPHMVSTAEMPWGGAAKTHLTQSRTKSSFAYHYKSAVVAVTLCCESCLQVSGVATMLARRDSTGHSFLAALCKGRQ